MHLFISVASLLRMEVNLLNENLCILSRPGVSWFDIFLSVALSVSEYMVILDLCSSICNCCNVVYPFGFFFFVMIFPFPYFAPICFCLFDIRLLVWFCTFPPPYWYNFGCFGTLCFVCIVWSCLGILFSLPSFASIFCLVSTSFIFRSSCCAFSVSSEYTWDVCPFWCCGLSG